jgi:hypothetical protein
MEEYIREAPRDSLTSKSVVSVFTVSETAKNKKLKRLSDNLLLFR